MVAEVICQILDRGANRGFSIARLRGRIGGVEVRRMNRIPEILVWLILAGAAAAQASEGAQPTVVDPGGPGKAPSDAIVLFDGKDNSHWMTMDGKPSKCTVADGVMICRTGAGDTQSTEKFRDAQIHVEFDLPYEPEMRGQGRANSLASDFPPGRLMHPGGGATFR